VLAACDGDCVDHPFKADRSAADQFQLGIEEAEIEPGIVRNQRCITQEFEQFVRRFGKARLGGQEGGTKAVDPLGLDRHIAIRVEIGVEGAARFDPPDHFDTADFHHAVPCLGIESGGFGVENNLTHLMHYLPKSGDLQAVVCVKSKRSAQRPGRGFVQGWCRCR